MLFHKLLIQFSVLAAVAFIPLLAAEPMNEPLLPGNLLPRANPENVLVPVAAKAATETTPIDGKTAFPKMLADAKAAYGKTRDYMGHIVRQERINGNLQAEQVGELRVRVEPFCISLKLLSPKSARGWEASYIQGKRDNKLRFKPADGAGANGFTTIAIDDPKVLTESRHTLRDTGMLAILERVERVVAVEKKANNPVQIVVSNYQFESRPVQCYEIYTERPHPKRYAHRTVVYIDAKTKLPVRFEAYDQPKNGSVTGEMIECISFVNLKWNSGLGDTAFDR